MVQRTEAGQEMSELILLTSEDGVTQMHLRVEHGTVWLTQLEIADLFQTTMHNVSLHAKNIMEERKFLVIGSCCLDAAINSKFNALKVNGNKCEISILVLGTEL